MAGFAELAMGAAPLAGGAMLGVAAGNLRGPDVRAAINKDLDLLERIPLEQTERRAALQHTIDERIDGLIESSEKSREFIEIAASYRGNWRDIVVFICAILFTIIWWNVNHSRSNWAVMFVAMILLSIIAGVYAGRGMYRAVRTFLRRGGEKGA